MSIEMTSARYAIEGDLDVEFEQTDTKFDATPMEVAEAAWEQVCEWVHTRYRPVIDLNIRGVSYAVDLEEGTVTESPVEGLI